MHAFTPDGKHLLLIDAHGLTRVTLPAKIKTDRDATGSWLCAGGPHALVRLGRHDRMAIVDAISLDTKVGFFSLWTPAALHPAGAHVIPFGEASNALAIRTLTGNRIHCPELPDTPDAGTLDLGPARRGTGTLMPQIAVGPDHALAWLDPRRGKLFVGTLRKATGPLEDLRAYAIAAPRGVIELRPRSESTFVCAYHPGERRAYCALIEPAGIRTRAVGCLGQVAFTGEKVVYQRDESTIVREPFEGGAAQTLALPSGAGAGEVMADGDVVCFAPEDRTRVINLTAKKEAARKPPEAARETYQFISGLLSRYAPVAAEAGQTLALADIAVPKKQGRCRPTLIWDV